MTVAAIPASNSVAKRTLYNPNQRVNSKTVGPIPGLEDDILVYPKAIAMILRELYMLDPGEIQWFGCDIPSFTNTTISTLKGSLLKDDELYFLEALSLQPTNQAFWGFYEIELVQQDSDLANLQFFDVSTNSSFQQNANTRKSYIVKVYENYNTTAAFPTLTPGRIKWFEYKKDAAFGNVISVNKISNSVKIPKNKNGTLITLEDSTALQIPIGSVVEDNLDRLSSSLFKDANGQAISRTSFSTLWSAIRKAVTGINPTSDRVIVSQNCIEGQLVKFSFTGGGITALTEYYVRNPTAADFQVSTTPTGSIIDLTANQSGDVIVNVEYGFGDGSTTFNLMDRGGVFARGSGLNGTRAKAAGGNYDGGAVGFKGQDMGHNHVHTIPNVAESSGTANWNYGSGTIDFVTKTTSSPAAVGGTGAPRTGNETTPAWVAVRYKVRVA
ncbi:phage tail protein [Leptospira adleri]|uniref:Phage tail protein n=1 Tax=Leptospira adleri TaxID=2023186 RepID=A0A2M9YJ61_9LEPT|nr:phage tail protein [Leptospira adleri]PJZ51579.1 phage tail protein [Leptospira adleri]PJZ61912.1 phage tail protein [Leptospira adleri]